jgi:hypothetical protein
MMMGGADQATQLAQHGQQAMQGGLYEQAAQYFYQAITLAPNVDGLYYHYATACLWRGFPQDALISLDRCMALRGPWHQHAAQMSAQVRAQMALPPPAPPPAPTMGANLAPMAPMGANLGFHSLGASAAAGSGSMPTQAGMNTGGMPAAGSGMGMSSLPVQPQKGQMPGTGGGMPAASGGMPAASGGMPAAGSMSGGMGGGPVVPQKGQMPGMGGAAPAPNSGGMPGMGGMGGGGMPSASTGGMPGGANLPGMNTGGMGGGFGGMSSAPPAPAQTASTGPQLPGARPPGGGPQLPFGTMGMSASAAQSSAAPHPQAVAAPAAIPPAPAVSNTTASVLNIIAKAVGAAVDSGALQAVVKQITK